MSPEIKQQWIDALESGEYEQGTDFLCRNNKYCCLGVLCEIAIKNGRDLKKEIDTYSLNTYRYYDNFLTYPPGLPPEYKRKQHDYTYAALNDCRKHTFKQIAQFIRENE